MLSLGISIDWSSGFIIPASIFIRVVLPVPFYPSITTISEFEKVPD